MKKYNVTCENGTGVLNMVCHAEDFETALGLVKVTFPNIKVNNMVDAGVSNSPKRLLELVP